MLSRVAESIYWMARYIERAENVARIMDANYHMILDLPVGVGEQWEPLVVTTGDEELFKELYDDEFNRENVVQFLTFDTRNPNSILSCLQMARENARSVREWISSEMWQQVNTFYLMIKDASRKGGGIELPHEFFVEIMMASHLFTGLSREHHDPRRRLAVRPPRPDARAGRQDRPDHRRQVLHPAAVDRLRRHPLRPHPLGGDPAFGERLRDVPQALRPDRPRPDHRVPGARRRVPAGDPPLPDHGRALAAQHLRDHARPFYQPRRKGPRPPAWRISTTPRSRRSRRSACTSSSTTCRPGSTRSSQIVFETFFSVSAAKSAVQEQTQK